MDKYFIPEAEIGLHNVSQKINHNIKIVKEFHDIPCFGNYRFFVKFKSSLILYAEDVWETKIIKIWKLDHSGDFKFLTDEGKPELMALNPLIFEPIPVIVFVLRVYENEIKQIKFSARKIPGIVSESVEIDDAVLNIDVEENWNAFTLSRFVGVIIDNLVYPSAESEDSSDDEDSSDELIWYTNEGKQNFRCLLILFELQLKEPNKYRLVEISRTNLETYTADLFVVKDQIFNEVEGILLIHVKAKGKVIIFLHNIKSKKIEESITIFENEPRLDDDGGSTKIFFVNHIDFEGGIIVAVSHVVKQMKVFSRCGKIGYRLLFSESLDINDVRHLHNYGAYCVSNRNNQILFFIVQDSGITVYDLFNKSDKASFAVRHIQTYGIPDLFFNESGEEFYLSYSTEKLFVYRYRSMLKSLASHAASVAVQTYTKSQLIEMRLSGDLYKFLKLFW